MTISDVLDKEGQETAKRFGDKYGKDKVSFKINYLKCITYVTIT